MSQANSTSVTRRSVVAGLTLAAAPAGVLAGADKAYAQAKETTAEKSLYEREWHTKNLGRLPGLKFMRTLWVSNVSGGPYQFTATKPGTTPLGLEEAHRDLRISPAEFDEVAAELGRTLDFVKVSKREKDEVLEAFAAHKGEVTAGYVAVNKRS
jgi:hemoglobin